MSLDLFYFLSTLPTLNLGEKPPFSHQDFLMQCQEAVSSENAKILQNLTLIPSNDSSGDDEVLGKWNEFETFVRNSLAEIRVNANFPRGTVTYTPKGANLMFPELRKQIDDAMALPSPMEREAAIDAIRWDFLEQLKAWHSFDFICLEVYSLQLLLVEKQASRNQTQGTDVFQEILTQGFKEATLNRISEQKN